MTDDTINFESQLEMASLLPERNYIILKQVDDDNFTLSAFDTTTMDEDSEYFPSAYVVQHGLIALMREDIDLVMQRGMESLAHQHVAEALEEYAEPDSKVAKVARRVREGNVVKVDFGREQ